MGSAALRVLGEFEFDSHSGALRRVVVLPSHTKRDRVGDIFLPPPQSPVTLAAKAGSSVGNTYAARINLPKVSSASGEFLEGQADSKF